MTSVISSFLSINSVNYEYEWANAQKDTAPVPAFLTLNFPKVSTTYYLIKLYNKLSTAG